MARRKNSEQLQPQLEQAENLAPQRVREPKKIIQLIIDAGRSSIKYQTFFDGASVTPVLKTDSVVCRVTATPFGEQGAFSMSRSKDEGNKDVVEHWIVGSAAKLQNKEYVAMTDGQNYKILYFPILCLGAITCLPNLYELSTGTSPKRRRLHINLSTLSLAEPSELRKAIEVCKWINVDGVKYSITFQRSGFVGFPEGYGASLWMQPNVGEDKQFLTFDIGFGTATVSQYSNYGSLPKRIAATPNGGGGISQLIREFSQAVANTDTSKVIKPSQLREVLETATIEDGKVSAIAPDGSDIGQALQTAINNWMIDSPLAYALDDLSIKARRNKVALCGGGFAIKPVHELIHKRLTDAGIPDHNLLIPSEPGIVALSHMKQILGVNNNAQQAAA